MLKKKSYIAPSIRTIEIINASEVLLIRSYGEITSERRTRNENYDGISGFDSEKGGWGTGFPD